MTVKEINRPLVPHTLTKRPEPKALKPAKPAQGLPSSSASPSAIKAAAKSAALHLARQIASDDPDNDDDVTPGNYFSLGDSSEPVPAVVRSLDPEPEAPKPFLPLQPGPECGTCPSDAPLDFGSNHQGAGGGAWGSHHPQYQQPLAGPEGCPPVTMADACFFPHSGCTMGSVHPLSIMLFMVHLFCDLQYVVKCISFGEI